MGTQNTKFAHIPNHNIEDGAPITDTRDIIPNDIIVKQQFDDDPGKLQKIQHFDKVNHTLLAEIRFKKRFLMPKGVVMVYSMFVKLMTGTFVNLQLIILLRLLAG
jgi:hypothetical protein